MKKIYYQDHPRELFYIRSKVEETKPEYFEIESQLAKTSEPIGNARYSIQMIYLKTVSRSHYRGALFSTYWDKNVWHFFLIALPSFTVLSPASINIPIGPMNNHNHKENKVKPREWTPIHSTEN